MALFVTFFLTLFIQACSGAPDVTEALLLIIPEAQQLGLTDLARLARMVLTVGMTTFLKFCEWRIDRAQRRASRGSGDHYEHHHDHHQEHHHQCRRPYMDMYTLTG